MTEKLRGLIERCKKAREAYADCAEYDGDNSGDHQNRGSFDTLTWVIEELDKLVALSAPAPGLTVEEAESVAEDLASDVVGHIDTMYPAMWEPVSKNARTSIRNTIINSLTCTFRNLRESQPEPSAAPSEECDAIVAALYDALIDRKPEFEFGFSWNSKDHEGSAKTFVDACFRAACEPSAPQESREVGWLIEREGPAWMFVRPNAHISVCWTTNSNGAVRFSRKQDAEAVKTLMQNNEALTVTEHVWMSESSRVSPASEKETPSGKY